MSAVFAMTHQTQPTTWTNQGHFRPDDPTPAIGLRVVRGALVPATQDDQEQLKRLNLSLNQVIHAQVDFQRTPAGLKKIHRLGQLLVENCEMFAHMDSHQAIKVLQSLSGVGCDVVSVPAGTLADLTGRECKEDPRKLITVFQPWSLSPRTMSGAQFARLYDQLCRYVATDIWEHCAPETINHWVEALPSSCP